MKKFILNYTLLKNLSLLIVGTFLLCSCSTVSSLTDATMDAGRKVKDFAFPKEGRAEYTVESGLRIYDDANIYLSDLFVNVAANQPLIAKPNVLFVPLGLVQESYDHLAISQGVSRIIWQQMLSEQTFNILEFSDGKPPYRVEHAIPLARAMGADFIMGGYITYFYEGGKSTDSKIAIQLEIYDTFTGALLWSVNQSGILPYKTDRNNVLFTVHTRMPMDSMAALISAMGNEMAVFFHAWTDREAMIEKAQDQENNKFSKRFLHSLDPSAFGKY